MIEERAVWFGDGDDLNVRAVEGVGEEAVGVAVNESGDGDAERWLGVGEKGRGEQKRECELCGEAEETQWHMSGSGRRRDDNTRRKAWSWRKDVETVDR